MPCTVRQSYCISGIFLSLWAIVFRALRHYSSIPSTVTGEDKGVT